MKTILHSLIAGALLASLAMAQASRSPLRISSRHALRPAGIPAVDQPGASNRRTVYVLTIGFEFGAVDLHSGTFLPIGPGLPEDVGGGLAPGPGQSLLSLAFSGNLVAIDPRTGETRIVGPTGLSDCTTPTSPCGPKSANIVGYADGHLYATDFANRLYSVDSRTGAAKLIGPTGLPAIDFIPFTPNPDGTLNVYAESLFNARGKLYANFSTAKLHPESGAITPVISGAIYQIDPKTGHTMLIAPTDSAISYMVTMDDTVYGFNAVTGQIVTVDVRTGQTTPVSDLDPAASVIAGATPARPAPNFGH